MDEFDPSNDRRAAGGDVRTMPRWRMRWIGSIRRRSVSDTRNPWLWSTLARKLLADHSSEITESGEPIPLRFPELREW
jgi:hypothetical protein